MATPPSVKTPRRPAQAFLAQEIGLSGAAALYVHTMEPTASIAVIETDLRHVARVVLSKAHGAQWLEVVADEDTLASLKNRLEEERKRRVPAVVPTDLTAYAHLYELRKIIEANWELFAPALGKKREFSVLMDKVEDFRNAPAHSRELLPHERLLLAGISGWIRTQVTTYVSQQSSDARHYPIIESIRDSFGNSASQNELENTHGSITTTGLLLQVGSVISFEVRGWDPRGRELTWNWGALTASPDNSATGTDVAFDWTIAENDVGKNFFLEVTLASPGPYHRHSGYDHRASFHYEVEPPGLS